MPAPAEHLSKAERYLQTARLALRAGDRESAVSRADYAALHACIALPLRHGRPPQAARWSKMRIFSEFIRLTTKENVWLRSLRDKASSRDLHDSLKHLDDLREDADYGVGIIGEQAARRAVRFAEALMAAVRGRM